MEHKPTITLPGLNLRRRQIEIPKIDKRWGPHPWTPPLDPRMYIHEPSSEEENDENEASQGDVMTSTAVIPVGVGGDTGQDIPTQEIPPVDVDSPVINNNTATFTDRECNGHLLQNGKVHQNGSVQHEVSVTETEEKEKTRKSSKVVKRPHITEKVVFVVSVATVSFLTHCVISAQYLIPYFYSITAPILLLIRCIMYWFCKWQYFLLDFCYYGNIMCYVFIWAFPQQPQYFCVVFALSNGPIMWALLLFRNSLVFHSFDKTVSIYIHIMPGLLSFTIRWFPEETSKLCCYMLHGLFNTLLVQVIFKPPPEYQTIYRLLTAKEKSSSFKLFDLCGPKHHYLMYKLSYMVFCLLSVLFTILWYNFFIAHCIFLSFVVLKATYNGACYYLDVFSVHLLKQHFRQEQKIKADNFDKA
ncbi:glycerophosphocholine acyltransferase 1-like [Haliotis rubra]|uniref:glycerophosphocholine acyltransferase 1-like n=1 Tax=Haliotis rubra TaxID=36100 RepID=UPI001EE523B7|nr:glycerophosphocholine acyltransferase 1-like [Haliotis rubra]